MSPRNEKLKSGDAVVLFKIPPGLLNGLPHADQAVISNIVGKPIRFLGFDRDGRAEVEFTDGDGTVHFIFVNRSFLRLAKRNIPSLNKNTSRKVAKQLRQMLKAGGSPEHSAGVQWFFKDEIKSHGWRAADLRRAAVAARREILSEFGLDFLLKVADDLFSGSVLEEKGFAVLMLEKAIDDFGDREFRRFESWLPRISSWADHDGLVHYLIAPMIAAKPARAKRVFRWARSKDRWHRRAACVALIQGTRRKMFFPEIVRLSNALLGDRDDMVQKGLGWLLRETAKADAKRTVPYLMKIRGKAPRLVLRTACETLSSATRTKILKG